MRYTPDQEPSDATVTWTILALTAVVLFAAAAVFCSCVSAEANTPTWTHSLATQYGSKTIGNPDVVGITYDKQAGSMFSCGGKMDPMRHAVAHRTLPCGSVIEVCKGSRCTTAEVWDSGPFHAVPTTCGPLWSQRCWVQGKTIAKRRLTTEVHAWRFASDLDLLPRVAWEIRLGGKAIVRWRVVSVPRKKH
jgi:hypothetical protein